MAAAKKPAKKAAGPVKKAGPAVSSSGGGSGDSDINFLLKGMREAVGPGNAMLLNSDSMALKIRGVISTRIPGLDEAIGRGGVPLGRITIIHGPQACGKTTVCLQVVAECQSIGGWAMYYDCEHKLDPDYAVALGCDGDRLIISQPDTVEEFFDSANIMVTRVKELREKTGKRTPVILVLDSINSAIAKAVLEGDAGSQHYAPEARVWSKQLPKLNARISREDIAVVLISQVREKIGLMFGDKDEIGGGNAPRFYASVILKCATVGSEVENTEKVANKTEVVVKKNQISPPYKKASFLIRYGRGAVFERSLLAMAVKYELVQKESTMTFVYNGETISTKGEASAAKWLRKNPEKRDELNRAFRKLKGWE